MSSRAVPGAARPRGGVPAPLVAGLLLLGVATPGAAAQLADLQPGRNFANATNDFGGFSTEDVDFGDVDHDGDIDVLVANGGNAGVQDNRIYINNGGLQGGTPGTFSDATATRLAGADQDTSRDVDFADFDGDGDLDFYVSNRGGSIVGQVSRAYVNQGGLQGGATGFFVQETDAFWGDLVSVLPEREVPQPADGQGPFRDWSCDCDFADLDDDGDVDLFHSTYGPNINGLEDSRVFLNDGGGAYDELWPWIDAAADIALHSLDIDLVDLDGDFDVDVFASSRESQARVYRNNHADDGWASDPFTDVTASALLPAAAQAGSSNYGAEYADLDGDGDFDIWATSYANLGNRVLRNDGDLVFVKDEAFLAGETGSDDNEADFLDFDGDGDLDVFVTGFTPGTNVLFTSGLAQGLTTLEGIYHRNGTSVAGSQAVWDEVAQGAQNNISLDGGVSDLDGDGDPDVVIVNDVFLQNRRWENVLGVPDVHAPTFAAVTTWTDGVASADRVVHAAVRDNSTYYVIERYRVELIYTVDGGAPHCVRMMASGGQVFRGVIPAALSYRVEATDLTGNTGVSSTVVYQQTSGAGTPWQTLGCGTPGAAGVPYFEGRGGLLGDELQTLRLVDARAGATALLFVSTLSNPAPFKGGTLYTVPIALVLPVTVDDGGALVFQLSWPPGVPGGVELFWQYALADDLAQGGVALSNAALSTTP